MYVLHYTVNNLLTVCFILYLYIFYISSFFPHSLSILKIKKKKTKRNTLIRIDAQAKKKRSEWHKKYNKNRMNNKLDG